MEYNWDELEFHLSASGLSVEPTLWLPLLRSPDGKSGYRTYSVQGTATGDFVVNADAKIPIVIGVFSIRSIGTIHIEVKRDIWQPVRIGWQAFSTLMGAFLAFPSLIGVLKRGKVLRRGKEGDSRGSQDRVKCHFRAEMKDEVLLKHVASVEVSVSREVFNSIPSGAAHEGKADVDPGCSLLIQVIPKRNFEMVSKEDYVEIAWSELEKPRTSVFDVRATHDDGGSGELWVVARQGQVPLLRLILCPRIVTNLSTAMGRVSSTATSTEAKALSEPLTQLFITEQFNGSELRYHFKLQDPKLRILVWDLSKPILCNRDQYVRKLYSEIENRWVSTAGDVKNFYEELRGYGAELFNELVPTKIQQALWQHRNQIDSIMVIAEEPFIPWEVVHLIEPGRPLSRRSFFLAEMGLVRWLEEAGWPKETIPLGAGRARFVIPNYPHPDYALTAARKEATFLKEAFDATSVEPTSEAVRELLSTPCAFDLLHFACHGAADQGDAANGALLLQGRVENGNYIPDYFTATTAEFHSNFGRDVRPGPFIMLNACQIGRSNYRLTGTGGFARAFLRRGASAFVGTLWSIGDAPALTFTKEFYAQLKKHDKSIADASKAARAKAQRKGDATWLAYVVYGHPHARLTRLIERDDRQM